MGRFHKNERARSRRIWRSLSLCYRKSSTFWEISSWRVEVLISRLSLCSTGFCNSVQSLVPHFSHPCFWNNKARSWSLVSTLKTNLNPIQHLVSKGNLPNMYITFIFNYAFLYIIFISPVFWLQWTFFFGVARRMGRLNAGITLCCCESGYHFTTSWLISNWKDDEYYNSWGTSCHVWK